MKKHALLRTLSLLLVVWMLVGIFSPTIMAVSIYDQSQGGSDYYNVISEKNWNIAPGVQETELVLNNDEGTRRQVLHTAIIDVNNPYVKVIPGTKGMWPQAGNYGTESTSTQALNAEKLGYGNVVVATNASLSWYSEAYYKENPHLIGEPLGYSILDGQMYANSRYVEGENGGGVQTIVVINYDYHPISGEARPADMPKVWIRSATDPLTGWEEQAIPVLFGYLVKPDADGNPVNQYKTEDHGSGIASRTFVGVRADGTLVLAVSDGEQAPYSVGFTSYEMADYMIKMGCVIAANCDGGGSTTFCSQRPGEDLKVNCSLADGGERPTSNTFLIVSTAPADGEFARASLGTDYDYYTPGSKVTFNALGTDAVGTKVDIPADVEWTVKEQGMGTVENGVFTSNGTPGTVTVQMLYQGNVVGEHSITIAIPEALSFDQPVVTIPFGKTATIPVKATIGGGVYEIGLGPNDVTFTTTNEALGRFEGLSFIAVDEANAPADLTSTVTVTLNMGTNPTATVQLNLGRASEVLWDFEGGQADVDIWNVINNRKNAAHWDYFLRLSLADRTNGQVHDGEYSMRLETNGLSSKDSHSEQYAWIRLGVDGDPVVLENARRVGFWLYVPEDNIQCWVQWHYKTDSDGDGVFDTDNLVSVMESENVYYNIDESGWHYLSMDISGFDKVALRGDKLYDKDPSDGMTGETGEFFLALVFHKGINNKLWQENGSINGNYTYYIDNFTVDYSDAVEDRENPIFDKIYLDGTTALVKRDVVTTTSNILNLSAAVTDKDFLLDADKNQVPLYNMSGLDASTAKVYIDGVEVRSTFANGVISADGIKVADGYHRVKFEICDNAGNKSVIIRVVKVESGSTDSTVALVPADPSLDRICFGSVYWMNLEATAIETIESVSAVIDLNNVNHWELDHMELAEGFTATYTVNGETNTATITITRTGDNDQTGAATLAQLPVRILYFDTDIKTPGYTAETYWTSYPFWAQDMKMDVDMGLITFTNGTTGTFSNEEFHVDTEMYTIMANMDKAYFSAHGTTHVHTPVALADKAPTCAENGYIGRTFCEGCQSVVEWGTTVPATGHTYGIADGKLVCHCGKVFNGTGLQIIDGKGCYAAGGKLAIGWLTIDDEWYYFDETTYQSVDSLDNGYVTFTFYPDGKVVSGQWYHSSSGSRYYYGLGYYQGNINGYKWVEIDGERYCFDHRGYCLKGINYSVDDYADLYEWHDFGTDGASRGKLDYTGIMHHNGNIYYLVDGCSRAGMFYADGAYYHANFENHYAATKNTERNCYYKDNYGLLPVGVYLFGHDGKMVDHNVYNKDGTLYYYVLGKISQGSGVFTYEGIDYVIEADGKVLFTGVLYDASGNLLYYENGVQSGDHVWDEGVITQAPTCTELGVRIYTCTDCGETWTGTVAKLAHVDGDADYNCDVCGNRVPHDHIWDEGVITAYATCTTAGSRLHTCPCGETKAEVIAAPGHVDENGDLTCEVCGGTLAAKNGLVFDADGEVRYYVDGVAIRAGLVRDSEGNYYYINSTLKAVKDCSYLVGDDMTNGLLPGGTYQFDAEGKIIDPPAAEPPHKHTWSEGIVTTPPTCDEAGVRTYVCACGLSKLEAIAALGHVDANGDYACEREPHYIPHAHIWGEGVVTTPVTCTDAGVRVHTCPCGRTKSEPIVAIGHVDADGDLSCDVCGEILGIKNGLVYDTDGEVRYYVDGVAIRAGLVQDSEGNYYYINSTLKAVKNTSYTLREDMTNGMLPGGTYQFDAEGKMIDPPVLGLKVGVAVGVDGEIRYYAGGRVQTSVMAQDAYGNYYYFGADGIAVSGGEQVLSYDQCGGVLPMSLFTETDSEGNACATFRFDEQGRIMLTLNGLTVDANGDVRYYENGVAIAAGLVRDGDGNYYFIDSTGVAVRDASVVITFREANGLFAKSFFDEVHPETGRACKTLTFDEAGYLILN